jgi:methylenetetrahydrofolate dehydrogenase (NADP+) / methenyltetrahydrofolate cyclohydrolase
MQEISTATIIDGKKIAERILLELKNKIEKDNLKLKLAVVLVGDDYASGVYVNRKRIACEKAGIDFELFNFSSDISEEELKEKIKEIADKPEVLGIIIQLPLPKKFNSQDVLDIIPKNKNAEFISPVVSAVGKILEEYGISLKNKKIVLVGRGKSAGGPLAEWLSKNNLEFSGIESIEDADIVISGVGKSGLIVGDMIKKGAVVIDIGFSHDKDKKAVGDVEFESVSKKASYITPVPGGVGPITVACLLENLARGLTSGE